MNKKILIIIIGIVVIIGGAIALTLNKQEENNNDFVAQNEIPENQEVKPIIEEGIQTPASTYLDYSSEILEVAKISQKSGRKVVLFFHAKWCPFCVAADTDFKANLNTEKFPQNLTLIKTDYDTESDLKKKYGVTYQHTFVQIDSDGSQLTKWIGGETTDLAKNIK